ncbi:hypothetical protein [Psychrobacter lutiphocae]|uniref:hypothetical protein n=1 Tax=Psychrobacter lutiphocae TaxID=540500 RepID=UPI00191A2469|nr:hypothetical protein [Psychrobacter lutiphocae]
MTKLTNTLDDHDFGKYSKTESNPRARLRLLILHQYSIGKSTIDIAKDLCIHPKLPDVLRSDIMNEDLKASTIVIIEAVTASLHRQT